MTSKQKQPHKHKTETSNLIVRPKVDPTPTDAVRGLGRASLQSVTIGLPRATGGWDLSSTKTNRHTNRHKNTPINTTTNTQTNTQIATR